jgi:hypothetical protein
LIFEFAFMTFSGIIATILGITATLTEVAGRERRVHHSKSLPLLRNGERFFFGPDPGYTDGCVLAIKIRDNKYLTIVFKGVAASCRVTRARPRGFETMGLPTGSTKTH